MGSDASTDLTTDAAARLTEAIRAVFDDFAPDELTLALTLGEIPDWDSMNSVNLVLELESTLDVDLQGVLLVADQSIGDLVALLRDRGAKL